MSRERELLKKALNRWDDCEDISESYLVNSAMEEIRDYLAKPEVKPLIDEEIVQAYEDASFIGTMTAFVAGIHFAEKHHGIGGGDE